MRPLCCLDNVDSPVILDASVAINLNAAGCGTRLLRELPHRFLVLEDVMNEITSGSKNGRQDGFAIAELIKQNHIECVTLAQQAYPIFETLVSGTAEGTLDDGEAATIAHAIVTKAIPVIDEKKANRICKQQFPDLIVATSIDIFCHPETISVLGNGGLADAVYFALKTARMSVLPHQVDWVVELIGLDRAKKCDSLPKSLRQR